MAFMCAFLALALSAGVLADLADLQVRTCFTSTSGFMVRPHLHLGWPFSLQAYAALL